MTDKTQNRLEELRDKACYREGTGTTNAIERWAVTRIEHLEGICRSLAGEELLHQEGSYATEMDRIRATLDQQQRALELCEKALEHPVLNVQFAALAAIQELKEKP